MNFDEIIQLQVLKLKSQASGIRGPLLDQMLEQNETPLVRQMCAKVSVELYNELESVCNLLGLSKREFIESAVNEAVTRAHEVMKDYDLWTAIETKKEA